MRPLLLAFLALTMAYSAEPDPLQGAGKALHLSVVIDVAGDVQEYVGDMSQAEFDEMNVGTKKFVTLRNVFQFDEEDGLRHPLSETSGSGRLYGYQDALILPIMRILHIIPVDPEKIGADAPKSSPNFQ